MFYGHGLELDSTLYNIGAAAGIVFNPNRRIVPTLRAHRLVEYVKRCDDKDTQSRLMEALFHAYFEEAAMINEIDVLVDIAACSVGLDSTLVEQFLQTDEEADVVNSAHCSTIEMGIGGVPFFFISHVDIDGNLLAPPLCLSGGQPVEIFEQAFAKFAMIMSQPAHDEAKG